MMKKEKYLTKDELVAYLENHSKLPTIVVEGKKDQIIYRWIEEDLNENIENDGYVDILFCNGRSVLFNVFLSCNNMDNVIFIADKDTFVYTNDIPSKYKDILFTTGYSIENDLIQGKKFINKWFNKGIDKKEFTKCLTEYIKYYAKILEVWKRNTDKSFEIKMPKEVLDDNNDIKIEYKSFVSPSHEVVDYLTNDYDLLIQGHALFNIINIVLHRKNRKSRPNDDAIYEVCYKDYESDSIKLLKERIMQMLHL